MKMTNKMKIVVGSIVDEDTVLIGKKIIHGFGLS